jgi:hypothetical protein
MNISYSDPLSKGWTRMKKILFSPFDLNKWFMIGFTAFLASLADCHGGKGGNKTAGKDIDIGDIAEFPAIAWNWFLDHTWWASLIVFGIFVIFVLALLFNWLSSRGKFMFLDNVVHNRALVSQPWRDYRKHGNSVFLWRLVFGLICLAIFIFIGFLFFSFMMSLYLGHYPLSAKVPAIIGMVLLFLTFMVLSGYIRLFLFDFVVPIMYKENITVTKAWGKFLTLLSRHFGYFLVYGLFIFLLTIVLIILIITAGLMTCCIGFIFLIIPYISSVILLPVSVTFRSLSLEFLEQFGPDYKIFPDIETLKTGEGFEKRDN